MGHAESTRHRVWPIERTVHKSARGHMDKGRSFLSQQ